MGASKRASLLFPIVIVVVLCSLGARAEAAGPLGLSASVHLHYGVGINNEENAPTSYGFGFGGKVGFKLISKLYVGALVDYYTGSTEERMIAGQVVDQSASTVHVAGELGYPLDLKILELIPHIGLGVVADVEGSDVGDFSSFGSNSFALSPGLTANLSFSPLLFATADVRVVIPTENLERNEKALVFAVGVGLKF